MSTDALWYTARGSGVVSLLLLTVTVAIGIATSSGRRLPGLPRFAVAVLHRNASLLAVVFLAVHVVTLLFDPYAQLKLVDLVLPFDATYRPLWVGLGTVGLDLLLALVVTSLLRHRIGRTGWKAIHWLAYVTWPVAVAHGLGSGSDAGTLWFRALTALCVLATAAAVAWRFTPDFATGGRRTVRTAQSIQERRAA